MLGPELPSFLPSPARHNGGKSRQLSSAQANSTSWHKQLGGLFTLSSAQLWRQSGGGGKLIAVVKVVLLVPEQNATTLTQSSEEKPHKSKDAP